MENDLLEKWNEYKDVARAQILEGVKKGMRRSAREIRKATLNNARAEIQSYNNHPNGKNEQESILDAVRMSKFHDEYDDDEMYIKVHVMGTGRAGSKTFRFRFLEKGTKERVANTYKGKPLKKTRSLGKINPRRFFGRARDSVNVQDIYLQELEKAIDSVNSK